MIDDVAADLTDHKSLAYEKLRKVRAAIAALRQPVPDANSCAHSWRDDGMVYRSWCSECGSVAVTGYEDQPYAKPLRMDESALASQQESRNGE